MRIIFNTSFIVEEEIENEWVEFIRKNYISILKEHRLCDDIIFTKVSIDQPEGKTYSLQLVFPTSKAQNYFLENWLPTIENTLTQKYYNRYVCFSSVLTEIETDGKINYGNRPRN